MSIDIHRPDIYVNSFIDITADLLKENKIKGILTDLDDTLVVHNGQTVENKLIDWLNMLKRENIRICIISNNSEKRILPFARNISCAYISNALKPCRYWVNKAIEIMNISQDEAAFVGDQIFTDIKAAKNAGIKSILVDPLGEKSMWFVRLKRLRENKIRKSLEKERQKI